MISMPAMLIAAERKAWHRHIALTIRLIAENSRSTLLLRDLPLAARAMPATLRGLV